MSSLAIHHIPPERRPATFREIQRVLKPGGRLLVADFAPPRKRWAIHAIGAPGGHAMAHNPISDLDDLIRAAGLTVVADGTARPMLRYVRAVRD